MYIYGYFTLTTISSTSCTIQYTILSHMMCITHNSITYDVYHTIQS